MKNHLKRIAAPRSWVIDRKSRTFITRPKPGAHSLDNGISLGIIIRDSLALASTMSEVKKLLNNQEVLVDGKRRKDHRLIVGLFDTISIPTIKKQWRVSLDKKGRLTTIDIPENESATKPCKVVGKKLLPKGKIQLNLHDGKNIITDKPIKVGETIIVTLPSLEIKEVISPVAGVAVILTNGKKSGQSGKLKSLIGNEATLEVDNQDVETAKRYLFVVGKQKPVVTLQ
ncbi:MAG: 30S ribosomal protein S4e [archaeon]|nr:30S ribosomal protein S4e [archaeon]